MECRPEPPPSASAAPDVAGVIAPPPLLYAAGFGAGLLADLALPSHRLSLPLRRVTGLPLLAGGILLAGWAIRTMRHAGTPVPPTEPATALVTEGPFRFTRNPVYLGAALCYAGLALLLNRLWSLALLPAVLAIVQGGVVLREERYLERRFGAPYRRYRDRVPRWLPFAVLTIAVAQLSFLLPYR
ncbi:MAG: methyltransferase family protein [Chloroflexota bacterium]